MLTRLVARLEEKELDQKKEYTKLHERYNDVSDLHVLVTLFQLWIVSISTTDVLMVHEQHDRKLDITIDDIVNTRVMLKGLVNDL